MRAWTPALIGVACAACVHRHRDTNAPGILDVRAPPKTLHDRTPVRPEDPGERMWVLTAGGFSGAGAVIADDTTGTGQLGAEISVHRGENDRSHADDDFFIFPRRYLGLNLGATMDLVEENDLEVRRTLLYAEGQWASIPGALAGGLAVDPEHGDAGPQVTVFYGDLYLRATVLLGEEAVISGGILVKLPIFSLVESR